MIQIESSNDFFQIQKQFSFIPFTQSEGWYSFQKSKGEHIVFFVDNSKETKIACWGRERKIPFIGTKLLRIESECYQSDVNEKTFKTFFAGLVSLSYAGIEINSNNAYLVDYETGIRRAGFVRPISFHSCPLTIEINLDAPFNFDRNWRRNLKKAQDFGLVFSELKELDDTMISIIVQMFKEMSDLKKLKYQLEPISLSELLASRDMRTFIIKNGEDKLIAARIIHEHNRYLSDVFAANSNEARECGATYFLMDSLLNLLKREKKLKFDFGRIPPSNNTTDSVYLFKNGSGGRKVQYNGEWAYYMNESTEYLMFLYRQWILRQKRY